MCKFIRQTIKTYSLNAYKDAFVAEQYIHMFKHDLTET